jgi:hypothetical protein
VHVRVFLHKLIDQDNSLHANILQIKAEKKQNQFFRERLLNIISKQHLEILDLIAVHCNSSSVSVVV